MMCGRQTDRTWSGQVEAGESRFQNIPHSMKSEEVLFSPEGTPEEEPVVGRMETESLSSLRDFPAEVWEALEGSLGWRERFGVPEAIASWLWWSQRERRKPGLDDTSTQGTSPGCPQGGRWGAA